MPVYEYECSDCGKTTDALRRMAQADEPIPCAACGSAQTRRKHSVFAAAASEAGGASLPMAGGGCCPCGKNAGACGMG